jgi:hypothetical protein
MVFQSLFKKPIERGWSKGPIQKPCLNAHWNGLCIRRLRNWKRLIQKPL